MTLQEPVPPLFIKHVINLDKTLATVAQKDKDSKKKMNSNNARALATMRQKLKKSAKENENDVKAFEEDPDAFEARYNSILAALAPAPIPKTKKVPGVDDQEKDGSAQDDFTTVGKGGKTYNFTAAGLFKTLAGVHESRGRKVRVSGLHLSLVLRAISRIPIAPRTSGSSSCCSKLPKRHTAGSVSSSP